MPCTLHSFRCVHFACQTNSTTCLDVLGNFAHHSGQALDILCKEVVADHISYPVRCPKCQGPIDLQQSRQDAYKALDDVQELISAAGQQYEYLEEKYHSFHFSSRAKTADSSRAALAHKQFAIKAMSRKQDPFFSVWSTILNHIFAAEDLLKGRPADPADALDPGTRLCIDEEQYKEYSGLGTADMYDLKEAIALINEARAEIGKVIVAQMDELLTGLDKIQASRVPRRTCKPDFDDDDLPSRAKMARTIAYKRWTTRQEDDGF